jgi:DNA polymerase-3 subunit gamma/tau
MSYQVLARKWRPRQFSEMVGQEHVLRALMNALDSDRVHHAFLFTGTRGVGKTTIARILAKSLNCETGVSSTPCGVCAACQEIDEGRFVDLIEVDAASRTKVEDTRELLDNVQYRPTRGRYKVYLIDEVHMLSNHSFNALLKTLEEPPPHIKFLLATTDPQKLPITILSRCLQFNLRRLHPELIGNHLKHILETEQIKHEDAAVKLISQAADGSMRDALSLLDQAIAYGSNSLKEADVKSMLGTIDRDHVFKLIEALVKADGENLIAILNDIAMSAPDYTAILAELLTVLHHLALLQKVPDAYDDTMGEKQKLLGLADMLPAEDIQLYYQIGLMGQRDLPFAPDPYVGLEMTLLRMLAFKPVAHNENVDTRAYQGAGRSGDVVKTQKAVPARQTASEQTTTSQPQREATPTAEKVTEPVQQVTAEPTMDEPAKQATASIQNDAVAARWRARVEALGLAGVLNELAMNCALESFSENEMQLALDPSFENLLTRERQSRFAEVLEENLGRKVLIEIKVQTSQNKTPAQLKQMKADARMAEAKSSIEQDGNVKNILETFDATVDTGSIQPVD